MKLEVSIVTKRPGTKLVVPCGICLRAEVDLPDNANPWQIRGHAAELFCAAAAKLTDRIAILAGNRKKAKRPAKN